MVKFVVCTTSEVVRFTHSEVLYFVQSELHLPVRANLVVNVVNLLQAPFGDINFNFLAELGGLNNTVDNSLVDDNLA